MSIEWETALLYTAQGSLEDVGKGQILHDSHYRRNPELGWEEDGVAVFDGDSSSSGRGAGVLVAAAQHGEYI